MSAIAKRRPKHLDLAKIRLPMPGFVSILHRVSGAVMFVLIPLCLYLLERSLASADTYTGMAAFVGHPIVKLVLLALLWAFLHHLFAGIRFLMLDLHVGSELAAARSSSGAVLVVSLILPVVLGVKLW